MIAPEYFNNHIAVEGEIVVKRVPNDTGSVVVWNSATKKLSIRTHAEIVADLNLATVNTNQLITGIKSFVTSAGNYAPFNNTLQIYADDGSLPSMTYSKGGSHVGQIMFNSDGFYFKNGDNNAFYNVKAGGFEKSNSDNNHVLLGGGDHKAVSDFALSSDLSNVVTTNTAQTVIADKVFKKITTTDWVIPRYLAFPDASGALPNYIGFYMWDSQWQVNWRDASNTHLYQLLDIDGLSKNATFYGNTTSPKFTTPGGNSDQWNEAYNALDNSVTLDTDQGVTGKKIFYNQGQNFSELPLVVWGNNGSKGGIGFVKGGTDSAILNFDTEFHFTSNNNDSYKFINAAGVKVTGSDDNHVVLGGGGNKSLDELMTTNTIQYINPTATKNFYTEGGKNYDNNSIWVRNGNGNGAGITFIDNGIGQMRFSADEFFFTGSAGINRVPLSAGGFKKEGSDNSYVLLGGGGHKPVSEFVAPYQLDNYWKKYELAGYTGFNASTPFAFLNVNGAQKILTGGLLTSDDYSDSQYIPNNGIYSKGNIDSSGKFTGSGFVKRGFDDNYFLLAGGNTQLKTDFSLSNHTHQSLYSPDSLTVDANTLLEDYKFKFNQRITNDSVNMFPTYNNANGIISIATHPGSYGNQIGFNGNQQMFFRAVEGGYFLGWKEFAFKDWVESGYVKKSGDTMTGVLNLKNLNSLALNGGQIINAANSDELYLGNPSVARVYLESGDNNLFHNRTGYGAGVIWDAHNFNPDNKANVSDLDKKDGTWIQSARNFPDGTLIRTNLDYSQDYGSAWLLEIKANMYGASIPMDCKIVGYIYGGSIINGNGYSTSHSLTGITALNLNGELCFWFPTMGYWHGFTLKVTDVTGGALTTGNRAYSIENIADPGGTKRVNIPIETIATRDWANNNFVTTNTEQTIFSRKSIVKDLGTNDYIGVAQHNSQFQIGRYSDAKSLEFAVTDDGTSYIQSKEAGVGYNSLILNRNNSGGVAIGGLPIVGHGLTINGSVYSSDGYSKAGFNDDYILLAGGGTQLKSDFALSSQLGDYWKKYENVAYTGINSSTPFSFLNVSDAQKVYMGGLLISDNYNDNVNIPPSGAFILGLISTANNGNSAQWNHAYNWAIQADSLYLKNNYLGQKQKFANDAVTEGTMTNYMPSSDATKPSEVIDGSLLTLNYSNIWSTQLLGDWRTRELYYRTQENGTWKDFVKILHSGNFNPDNKVNKSGDTMTGTLSFANNVGGVLGTMGDDDYYRIIGRTNGYDNGYLEIATADGGTEPVHVRQYAGVFTNLIRTATLLDENGNTSFPGTVYSQGFVKANSDNSMLLLGGGGHKPISDFATVSQLGNFVSKSGDTMTGSLVISTNNDALTVTTSGSVLNAKLYNSSSDSIIRMQSITHPFWDIRAQADGRFLLENNSVTRLSMDSSANINFSGTSLKFNGHNIWDVNNLNPVTLDTPQTIVNEKTFSSGLGLTGGKSIFLKGFSDTAHRVQWFDDDSDGFAVSSAFSVKPYNDLSVSWFTANSGGAYSNGNRIWDAGNLIPVKLDGSKSSILLSDIGFNNLNDLQQTGFFKGSNLINAPLNSPEWFFLICEYHYTGWVSQTATSYGTGSVKAGRTFKRSFTGGTTWTDWNEVITTLTFNPDHYQPIGSYLTTNTTQTIDVTKTIGFQNTIYSGWDRSSVTNPQMGPFSLLNLALQGAYPLYGDEEFRNGSNNIIVYNNYGNGTVTMTRETASNLPNRSGVQLRFNYNGNGATPGLGGFILGFNARPNAVFIQKFMAKLPVGYAFNNAENYMGDNASVNWLTSRAGTGKWETYVRAVICGTGTSFGNGGHVYVEGPDTAMEFCLAFAEIYEINSSVFSRIKESFYAKNETVHFNGAISDLITVGDSYAQKRLLSTSWDGTNGDQILFRVPGNQNNGAYLRYSQYGTLNGNIGLFGSDSLTGGQILNANGDVLYVGNHALPNILLQAVNNVHLNYAGAGSIYTFNVNGVYLDRNINFNLDNSGINLYDGGKIYKKAGGGVYINKGNNGLDPRIENADGSQSWAIFHEGNYIPFKNLRGGAIMEEVSESGIYRQEGSTSGYNYTTTLNLNSSDGRQQLTIERSGGGMKFRGSYYGSGNQGWSDWKDVIHSGNITAYLNNYAFITQSNLNTQLAGYATLNGVQTFTNTNTFTSSPVIPNGTLGTHAVNKNQIQLNTGTEGENGQQLTISGNNSVNLTNFFVTSRDGSRNPDDIAPNSTPKRVRFDFAYATTAGLGGSGNYAGIMTYSPWDGTSASTGDSSYQLAFANQTGVDGSGIPMLKIRKGINGNWTSLWYKFWTEADFSLTNIQQWNHIAQFGLQLNQTFSATTGYNLMISDDYFGNESGLVDAGSESFVAGRVKEYYKYGSRIKDGLEGINYHLEKRTIGIGGEADKNKVSVKGCVKATENFKSKDERADTIFIPDGNVASLKDEIINDESEYAIRLDPHHYEIDPSGYLEVDDRNRLIHVIGEQVKMAVDFKEIYPKQQIVIYNFDQKNYPLAVLIKGKVIYNIEPGLFLRLYVTESLRVIAERPQPCEFVW